MEAQTFRAGDRVYVSPLHEESHGWYATVTDDCAATGRTLVTVLPESIVGTGQPRGVYAACLKVVTP